MPNRTGVHFVMTLRRQHEDRRWVLATLRRRWFDVAERSSASSLYAETWLRVDGMNEAETVAAALHDLRLAVLDKLALSLIHI